MTPGAESSQSTVPLLTYGRERLPRMKRWLKRFGLLLWIAAVLALAWDKWGVMIRVRVGLYLATREVLAHAEPADRVVFASDAVEVERLLAMGDYKSFTMRDGARRGNKIAIYQGMNQRVGALEQARHWANEYYTVVYPPPPPDPNAIPDFSNAPDFLTIDPDEVFYAYCGIRNGDAAADRVVLVAASFYAWDQSVALNARTDRNDWRPDYVSGKSGQCTLAMPAGTSLRIYAGQPDVSDSARFTLRYATGTGEGLVVGMLAADGTVDLKVASGPLAQPADKALPDLLKIPGQ